MAKLCLTTLLPIMLLAQVLLMGQFIAHLGVLSLKQLLFLSMVAIGTAFGIGTNVIFHLTANCHDGRDLILLTGQNSPPKLLLNQ